MVRPLIRMTPGRTEWINSALEQVLLALKLDYYYAIALPLVQAIWPPAIL